MPSSRLYLFTKYRTLAAFDPTTLPIRTNINGNAVNYDTASSIYEPLAARAWPDLPSNLLLTIVSTHAFVILVPGITLTLTPFSDDTFLFLIHFFGLNIFPYICMVLSVVAVAVFSVSTMFDALKLRNQVTGDHAAFYLWSLVLQTITFIVLGVTQYLRPDRQAGWEMKNKTLEWFLV